MHHQLRERETDALFVEYGVNLLVHIKINSPVISTLYPNTDNYIHAAGIQGMESYKRFGSIQNTAVFGDDTTHGAFYLVIILTIFHTNHPIHATGVLAAVIGHGATAQRTVRDIDYLIVGCGQNRMEDLDFAYCAGHSDRKSTRLNSSHAR